MRRIAIFFTWLLVLAFPGVAFATDLMSGGAFLFDIQDGLGGSFSTDGSLSNGSIDAYDGCYRLEVNGVTYSAGGATTSLGGRQIELPAAPVGTLSARRFIYVPATGGNYARYLDVVSNPGASAVMATIAIVGNLGSDSSTRVIATASGDTLVTAADAWFSTDDTDGSGDPSLAHIVQGSEPPTRASEVSIATDNLRYAWSVSIPAGGRVAILTFAVQDNTQALAQAEARRLIEGPDDALVGLDDYLDDIINYSITVEGAPRVRFDGPFEMEEGAAAELTITVTDPEGDTPTWSWDLDGDGTFGETPGATSYSVAAGSTDGPGTVRIGVRATDGTNMVDRYRTITVRNVAPIITSAPRSLVASVGASFRYQVVLDDPGAAFDPPTYAVTRGPSDMVFTADGTLVWIPDELDVTTGTESVGVTLVVDDGDEGSAEQSFELTVSPNRAPSEVVILYPLAGTALLDTQPRLVVASGEDPDRDPIQYFFELSTDETFESPIASSGATELTPGYTAWTVPDALTPGRYHWRVWASDGVVETEPRSAHFIIVPDPSSLPDGGLGDGSVAADAAVVRPDAPREGCSVGAGSPGLPSGLWLVLAALFVLRRRRR